jgi:hypothetical protein
MYLESSLDGAVRLAVHSHMPKVAERVGDIRSTRAEKKREAEEKVNDAKRIQYAPAPMQQMAPVNYRSEGGVGPAENVFEPTSSEPTQIRHVVAGSGARPIDRKLRKPAVNPFALYEKKTEAVDEGDIFDALRKVTAGDDKSGKKRKVGKVVVEGGKKKKKDVKETSIMSFMKKDEGVADEVEEDVENEGAPIDESILVSQELVESQKEEEKEDIEMSDVESEMSEIVEKGDEKSETDDKSEKDENVGKTNAEAPIVVTKPVSKLSAFKFKAPVKP